MPYPFNAREGNCNNGSPFCACLLVHSPSSKGTQSHSYSPQSQWWVGLFSCRTWPPASHRQWKQPAKPQHYIAALICDQTLYYNILLLLIIYKLHALLTFKELSKLMEIKDIKSFTAQSLWFCRLVSLCKMEGRGVNFVRFPCVVKGMGRTQDHKIAAKNWGKWERCNGA